MSDNKVFKEILRCNYFVKTGLYAPVVSISVTAVTGCVEGFCAINLPFFRETIDEMRFNT